MPTISAQDLQSYLKKVFVALGAREAASERIASSLVLSNLVGHDSHGAIRLPQYVRFVQEGRIDPKAETTVEREAACTARLNGNWGWGQVAGWEATQVAITKARQTGVAAVALCCSNHIGRAGEYVEEIARNGMIGLLTINNHGGAIQVAPFGGRAARLSSNPLAFAAPTSGDPILVDMTSAVVAEGKVRVLRNQGKQAPEGWLIDAEGNATCDPRALYTNPPGALLPLGGTLGHKGYGLGVMIDILSGGLSGAGCSMPGKTRIGNAMFVQALSIEAFSSQQEYLCEVDGLAAALKDCPPAAGFKEVLLPGEPERRMEKRRRQEGIPIDEETWHQVSEAAASLNVPVPAL
ncbi:MAG: Ldh family oxidoreductase [Anaerolineae bacterium]